MKRSIGMLTVFFLTLIIQSFLLHPTRPLAHDYEQVSPQDKIVIRFSHVTGEDTPKGLAAERFAQLMKERTHGHVEVQVFANSTLFSDGEELEKLRTNNIQMIAPAFSKMVDVVPDWGLFDLPFLFQSPQEIWQVEDGEVGQELFNLTRKQNLIPLAMWDNGFKQITTQTRPVLQPDDFNGLSFRTMPSPVLQQQFQAVGATAQDLPFDQLYQALVKNQVNSEENTISNIYNKRLYRVQQNITLSNHGFLGYLVLTNPKFWNSLSPDLQSLVQSTLQEVTQWERLKAIEVNQRDLQLVRNDPHVHISQLSNEQIRLWKKAFSPVYDWYRENNDPLLLDQIRGRAPD